MRANILYNVGAQSGIIILIASSFGHTQFGYRLIVALAAVVLIAAAFLVLKAREYRGSSSTALRSTTPALGPAQRAFATMPRRTLNFGCTVAVHTLGRKAVGCLPFCLC